jgi:hypothetical protein
MMAMARPGMPVSVCVLRVLGLGVPAGGRVGVCVARIGVVTAVIGTRYRLFSGGGGCQYPDSCRVGKAAADEVAQVEPCGAPR